MSGSAEFRDCEPCFTNKREVPASHICKECGLNLCDYCCGKHKEDRKTRLHRIKSVREDGSYIVRRDYSQGDQSRDKSAPGKPIEHDVLVDSISIIWEAPDKFDRTTSYYHVEYKNASECGKWKQIPDEDLIEPYMKISNLPSETDFVFRVKAIIDDNDTPYSLVSDRIRTKTSSAGYLIGESVPASLPDSKPSKRVPPQQLVQESINKKAKTKTVEIRKAHDIKKNNSDEKTIMLVGATGTGKSTMVDGIANYVLGVNWGDPYRFTILKLEKDEKTKQTDQSISQTEWITCYKLYTKDGGKINYNLNIIDTPGFGDTRGIERDENLVKQIRTLFSTDPPVGIQTLDAVCFIVKAPDSRLTATQRYIFQSIMSVFGKDIEENICTMITFIDGQDPPVLACLKASGLPFGENFKFNNSGLFAENTDSERNVSHSHMFWNIGMKSFKDFFYHLDGLDSKSLTLTNEVLTERQRLRATVDNLSPLIDDALGLVYQLNREIVIIKAHEMTIKENKDFEFEQSNIILQKQDLPDSRHVTNCDTCEFTCHKNCKIKRNEHKHKCIAMTKEGYCKCCPKGCPWQNHTNNPFIYVFVENKVRKSYFEYRNEFSKSQSKLASSRYIIEKQVSRIDSIYNDISACMDEVRKCNQRLAEIALQPNPLTMTQHIEEMIRAEQMEKRPGYLDRTKVLIEFKKRANVDQTNAQLEDEIHKLTYDGNFIVDLIKGLREKIEHCRAKRISQR